MSLWIGIGLPPKISTTGTQGPAHRIWRNSCIGFHPYIEAFLNNHEHMYLCFVLVKPFLLSTCLPLYTYDPHLS